MTQNVSRAMERSIVDDLAEGLLGSITGFLIGEVANLSYSSRTPEGRAEWDRNRIMHHGDVGCLTLMAGGGAGSPFLVGLGAGLMVSDAKDVNDWVLIKNLNKAK